MLPSRASRAGFAWAICLTLVALGTATAAGGDLSTAKRYASNARVAAGVLDVRVLERGPDDVREVACHHRGTYAYRCTFLLAYLDGDEVWRGRARLRAHSFRTNSIRFHYSVRGRIRACNLVPPHDCRVKKIRWRGNTRTAFPTPGVE